MKKNFSLIEDTLETMDTLISNVLKYSSAGYETYDIFTSCKYTIFLAQLTFFNFKVKI